MVRGRGRNKARASGRSTSITPTGGSRGVTVGPDDNWHDEEITPPAAQLEANVGADPQMENLESRTSNIQEHGTNVPDTVVNEQGLSLTGIPRSNSSDRDSLASGARSLKNKDKYFPSSVPRDEFHQVIHGMLLDMTEVINAGIMTSDTRAIVKDLFAFSGICSETEIRRLKPIYMYHLRRALEAARVIEPQDMTSSNMDILFSAVAISTRNTSFKKAEPSTVRALRPTSIATTRSEGTLVETDRTDHRGYPIFKQSYNRDRTTVRLPPAMMPVNHGDRSSISSSSPKSSDDSKQASGSAANNNRSKKKRSKHSRFLHGNVPRQGNPHETDSVISSGVKEMMNHLSKDSNRWSGPQDVRYSTAEYRERLVSVADIFHLSRESRLQCLPFALSGDAYTTYNNQVRLQISNGEIRSVSRAITTIGHLLTTPELMSNFLDAWNNTQISGMRGDGDDVSKSFGKLVRLGARLQRQLPSHYQGDALLRDFYVRAVHHESFWAYVDNSNVHLSAYELTLRIQNAIEKQRRLSNQPAFNKTMSYAMENKRYGKPDNRQEGNTNPTLRDGTVMKCNGCGSPTHFWRDCKNPEKHSYRDRHMKKAARLPSESREAHVRSYFLQSASPDVVAEFAPEYCAKDAHQGPHLNLKNTCGSDGASGTHETCTDDHRALAHEMESMFSEFFEQEAGSSDVFERSAYDSLNISSTQHLFWGQISRSGTEQHRGFESRNPLRYPATRFYGIMCDDGSSRSISSVEQLQAYRKFSGFPAPMRHISDHYTFSAHGQSKCIGIARFRFPKGSTYVDFDGLIVRDADIPLILGLRELDLMGATADGLKDILHFKDGSSVPIVRDRGHKWIRWSPSESMFTEEELRKLHLRFGHPGSTKLLNFLRRASPNDIDSATRSALEDIQRRCQACQRYAPKPRVFKVSVPTESLKFNHEVVVDIMYINGSAVLHVVDRATHFQAARFLEDDSAATIWRTFMELWILTYLGPPDNLRHDQGVQFVTPRFQAMAAEAGISCRPVAIESPNAMSVGERYHAPLRKTFLKLRSTYNQKNCDASEGALKRGKREVPVSDHFLLSIAVSCINTMMGPEGIVPVLLVFGALPKLPIPGSEPASVPHAERMRMMRTAMNEYETVVAQMRYKQAQKSQVPRTPPLYLSYNDPILVYRDTSETWEPRKFIGRNEDFILAREPTGEVRPYAISKVKVHEKDIERPGVDINDPNRATTQLKGNSTRARISELINSNDEVLENGETKGKEKSSIASDEMTKPTPPFHYFLDLAELVNESQAYSSDGAGEENEMSFSPCEGSDLLYSYDEALHTKVVGPDSVDHTKFSDAIATELSGLKARKTFIEMRRSEFPSDDLKKLNILRSRFVLAIKEPNTEKELLKARLVVQAVKTKDRDKSMLLTHAPTVVRSSVRLMLAMAASYETPVFLRDISQAYVSSDHQLLRDVYIVPPRELRLDSDVIWKVIRPLYGLPEAGLLWFETYVGHHKKCLSMRSAPTDPCFLFRHNSNGAVDGMICVQVDDSAGTGTAEFLADEDYASKQFISKRREILTESNPRRFNGQHLELRKTKDGTAVILHQRPYISRIGHTSIARSAESFAMHRGQIAYIAACSRPDVTCTVNQLSQIQAKDASEKDFQRMERLISRLRASDVELVFNKLDLSTVEVHVFADAAFACNPDLSSQLGYVILLVDGEKNCSLISWSSQKCRRVTRSVLAAELYAVSAAYDSAYAIRDVLSKLVRRLVALQIFTDSRTLFDSLTTMCSMTEKRLLIDIAGLREAFRNGDLTNVAWIRTQFNVADALTKDNPCDALSELLSRFYIDPPVGQWIVEGHVA